LTREELARAAASLTEKGFWVFPCLPSKAPATPHGFKDSVDRPERAYRLFCGTPGAALIGVPTGAVTMILVIDIDPVGVRWFRTSIKRFPETRVHHTRRGGYHLIYRMPLPPTPLMGNSAGKLASGVDTRGEGGYVIWPPSPGYEAVHEAEIAPLPRWTINRLTRKSKGESVRQRYTSTGEVHLDRLTAFVVHSRQGERNERAFWAACRAGEAVAAGKISESMAISAIAKAAQATGLPDLEAWRTARSGVRRQTGLYLTRSCEASHGPPARKGPLSSAPAH
jgi:Bifunctional DNA primase/polymerase, N-terminal